MFIFPFVDLKALSARNVQLITWLCSKMDPHAIFSMRPLPLSQYVLLSLIQQLGFDLTRDTELKLTWLREAGKFSCKSSVTE